MVTNVITSIQTPYHRRPQTRHLAIGMTVYRNGPQWASVSGYRVRVRLELVLVLRVWVKGMGQG